MSRLLESVSVFLRFLSIALIIGLIVIYADSMKISSSSYDKLEGSKFSINSLGNIEKLTILSRNKIEYANGWAFFGKKTYIHFWATWCGACLDEVPEILEISKKAINGDKVYVLIAVKDDVSKIKRVVGVGSLNLKNVVIAHDAIGEVSESFGTFKLPETYLIDENKRFVKKYIGTQNWSEINSN